MSRASSLDPLQQPHQHDGAPPELHDKPDGPYDGREVPALSASQQALPDIADQACPESPRSPDSFVHIGSDLSGWKRLVIGPLSTHERISLITTIFSSRDEVEAIKRLSGKDAQIFVNALYEMLDVLDQTLRSRCLRFLCKICGRCVLLPEPLVIPVSYDRTKVSLYRGGFADVWKGTSRGLEVAVKELKLYESSDKEKIRRGFCKEVVAWSALRHPNVLPLLGATMIGVQFVMVSEWMVNGNINEFVKVHPDADRLGLLGDVGRGLEYLHGRRMIHGDLKGANILIDRDGHACITDFGLLTIIPDQASFVSTITRTEGGTLRWMSPELLDPESFGLKDGFHTKESDCYALGMVIYEVLSGQAPFSEYKNTVVIRKVMEGERPGRPQGERAALFTDDLWGMLELCWKPQPHDRPNLKALLGYLEGGTSPSQSPPPALTMVEDVVTDTDDLLDSPVTDLVPTAISGNAQLLVPPQIITWSATDAIQGGEVYEDQQLVIPTTPRQLLTSTVVNTRQILNMVAPQDLSPVSPAKLRGGTQVPQDFPPIVPEDLAKLGVESQLIPFAVSAISQVEQSSNNSFPLSPAEAEELVEVLDKVVSSPTANPILKDRCFRVLRNVSPVYGVLPKSYFLPGVAIIDGIPHAAGGFADIWKGLRDGSQVCVKVFRIQTPASPDKIKRGFYREIVGWKHVSHPNVVSFLGISETLFPFCIISPRMPNGNIIEYIQKHRGVNRLRLLAQAACGLEYLHSLGIVHGGINPGNVLITEDGDARLGDFGIMGIVTDPTVVEPGSMATSGPGLVRYTAPELLNPSKFDLVNSKPSMESDVYSLAVTAYEALTEVLPYGNAQGGIITFQVVSGDRPPRPKNARWLQDHIWDMITACWSEEREQRPDVHTMYNQFSAPSVQEVPDVEPDAETVQVVNAVGVAPSKDLTLVPSSAQVEEPKSPAKQEATIKRKKNSRSQTAPVPNTLREPAPKRRFTYPVLPDRGRGTNEPGSNARVRGTKTRKPTILSRGWGRSQTVVNALRASLRSKKSTGIDGRPS